MRKKPPAAPNNQAAHGRKTEEEDEVSPPQRIIEGHQYLEGLFHVRDRWLGWRGAKWVDFGCVFSFFLMQPKARLRPWLEQNLL